MVFDVSCTLLYELIPVTGSIIKILLNNRSETVVKHTNSVLNKYTYGNNIKSNSQVNLFIILTSLNYFQIKIVNKRYNILSGAHVFFLVQHKQIIIVSSNSISYHAYLVLKNLTRKKRMLMTE